ncbi:MAG: rhomboid family intramembrane serine protease [Candidatus Nitrosopolaris sp.]
MDWVWSRTQIKVIRDYGFVPYSLFHINDNIPNIIARLISSIFIHSGDSSSGLQYFGSSIGPYSERSVGITSYVVIYILSGITGVLFHSVIASYILGTGHIVLIGASGAISGVLGIAAVIGNTRAYYWLVLQIVFAIFGSFAAFPIAFTAHIGGILAGVILTKLFVIIERKKRIGYYNP